MEFKSHIVLGAVLAALITIVFDLSILEGTIIYAASILIDIDHYFWYAKETKDKNPLNAIRWYVSHGSRWKEMPEKKRREYKRGAYIFHNWVCWTILIVLGYVVNPIFYLVLVGFAIHIVPDLIVLAYEGGPIMQKISMGYILKRNKGKKSIREYNKYFENK